MNTKTFMIFLVFAQAIITAGNAEIQNPKFFDNCVVGTTSDDFTDEKTHQLFCRKGEKSNSAIILFCNSDKNYVVTLRAEGGFCNDLKVKVKMRFDKEEVIEKEEICLEGIASIEDADLHSLVLKKILSASIFVYQIGNNKGSVTFRGGANAVNEYINRCRNLGINIDAGIGVSSSHSVPQQSTALLNPVPSDSSTPVATPIYFAAELAPTDNIPTEAPLCYKFMGTGPEAQLQKLRNKYPGLYDDKISINADGTKILVAKRKDAAGNLIDYFYSTNPAICNEYQKQRLKR